LPYIPMVKTTVYLPEDLKESIAGEALGRGTSEAEIIREALEAHVVARRPRGGVYRHEDSIAGRAEELLAEKHRTRDIVTLDRRHFSILRFSDGSAPRILPAH